MVRQQEDHVPQRGIIGGSTPHQQWLVAPSRAHTENLRTVERSIKMHKERLGAIGRSRGCRAYPYVPYALLVHLDAALDGAQVLRVPPVLRDEPLLVRRASADDAALRQALLLLPYHRALVVHSRYTFVGVQP